VIEIRSGNPTDIQTECLVIPVCEDAPVHTDQHVGDLLTLIENIGDFKGRTEDTLLLYQSPAASAARVMFVGLGKRGKIDGEGLRGTMGKVVKECMRKELTEVVFCAPDPGKLSMDGSAMLTALFEGALLSNHRFDHYKKEKKNNPLHTIGVHTNDVDGPEGADLARRIGTVCSSVAMAREWVSMPPNEKRPDRFVRSIHKAAEKEKIHITVLDEQTLRKNKMGGILAVGAGSRSRPRMLILDYRPGKRPKASKNIQTAVLVGKGVTFDSGGINLKTSSGLEDMKMDMAGAAAVAGILIAMARLKAGCRLIGLIPIVENMISGDASRPGDIIRMYAGQTVEITNTDAEGRLILADAMAYAVKNYKPDLMIDLATLTGACVVALGEKIAGVFSPDDALADAIVAAGDATHERCWRLPLAADYKEMLKSDFADMKNAASNRLAGAITAALFLENFVGDARWAHVDIAGPAYGKKEGPYCPAGGTGFGVRLVIEALNRLTNAS
jgi:leucyl aminopeptidase